MLNSKERMAFIIKYISAYKEQIELANSAGLFDSAKLFENFACELCKLWFGQNFTNLNDITMNYPYFDLLSNDGSIHVQVSTTQNVPIKIKNTLEKIRDSNDIRFQSVQQAVFFVLNNDSVEHVVDYCDADQIGSIPFRKKDHLITTSDIVAKAESDNQFQQELYKLLFNDFEGVKTLIRDFQNAISFSKSGGLQTIDVLINDEYEIDRSKRISVIKNSGNRFICIQGGPGSGKSVLCKKAVEGETNVLFARAERIAAARTPYDIWGIDIEAVIKYLADQNLYIFIDSLEFIADAPKSQLDILYYLYGLANENQHVHIITSCRTNDKNAFLKLASTYDILTIELDYLSSDEIALLVERYPVLREMQANQSYASLLSSPFYINLIVSKIKSIDNINDENQLREAIWNNVICAKEKACEYGISNTDIEESVTGIVFKRARDFSLGIPVHTISDNIRELLLSEGVIIESNNLIRLKYDIFEDICFERYFDEKFISCRGDFAKFIEEIESLGRCVYRRYQIWISNKIFTKDSREKFLYHLIFSPNMPKIWHEQTIIGIINSKYCSAFFEEYQEVIIETGLLQEFIDVTNLYGFEAKSMYAGEITFMKLTPIGSGRLELIRIIQIFNNHKSGSLSRNSVIKICTDYANIHQNNKVSIGYACKILEDLIDELLIRLEQSDYYYDAGEELWSLVFPLYLMVEESQEWILSFWNRIKENVKTSNHCVYKTAEFIVEKTIYSPPYQLVKKLLPNICELADFYWTSDYVVSSGRHNGIYSFDDDRQLSIYGLNSNASDYRDTNQKISDNQLFKYMFMGDNFYVSLDWTIEFLNKCVTTLVQETTDYVKEIELYFPSKQVTKRYYGTPEMWLAFTDEGHVPFVIGDIVFALKERLCTVLDKNLVKNGDFEAVFSDIKNIICQKSNNVILFSVLAHIGMQFTDKLPGYAIEFATSIEIVLWDLQRYGYVTQKSNPIVQGLLKSMLQTVGLPNMKVRYDSAYSHNMELRRYMIQNQVVQDEQINKECSDILDWLYKKHPNDKEDAMYHLQIQQMDTRKAHMVPVNNNEIMIVPQITGEASKVVEQAQAQTHPYNRMEEIISEYSKEVSEQGWNTESLIHTIDQVQKLWIKNDCLNGYSQYLVLLICVALQQSDLPRAKREEYCKIWMGGIQQIFENGSFVFEYATIGTLFSQLDSDISEDVKSGIKQLMLDCVIDNGGHGIIENQFLPQLHTYLANRPILAKSIFNCIVMLAKDEMQHQCYNANYARLYRHNEDSEVFVPNMQPRLRGVDRWIEQDHATPYESQKEIIIAKYLFEEEALDLTSFSISDYDIHILIRVSQCGLTLLDTDFKTVIQEAIKQVIAIWENDREHRADNIINVYDCFYLIKMLQREISTHLGDTEFIFDLLFPDSSMFYPVNAVDFYHQVFQVFACEFFDSYANTQRRLACIASVKQLEKTISNLSNDRVKKELYSSLVFADKNGYWGDWSKLKAKYSFADKQFLNYMFAKYGKYHLKEIIRTIYRMHVKELLPEILISFNHAIIGAKELSKTYSKDIIDQKVIVLWIVSEAFLKHSDQIKGDYELTSAYESILTELIELRFETAAVLLDEFRIH